MYSYSGKIEALRQFALDNYDLGGHWVVETFDNGHYIEALLEGQNDLKAAKEVLREYWTLMNEQQAETRWA